MRKHIFVKLFVAFFATFGLTLCISCPTEAADDDSGYHMQVSPTYVELEELKPGKTYSGDFRVMNNGDKDFDFDLSISPYTVSDQYYTADSSKTTEHTIITDWITITTDPGTLAAGESKKIEYTISVPKDAPGGGQYALINVSIVPKSDEAQATGVKTTGQIGFRVLADIDGETRREGKITEQGINTILFNPPITATSIVENTGNTHLKASYVLQVFPLFSDEEVYTNEENPTEVTVLPDTTRFNSISWDGAPHLGIFRVKQTVTIANDEQTVEKIVFLCPIWFAFIILLLVFFVVFWLIGRAKNRKEN